jgi:hypothetical protein
MSDEQVEAMLSNFTEQDSIESKTWTRIVVENYLSKVGERQSQKSEQHRGRAIAISISLHQAV